MSRDRSEVGHLYAPLSACNLTDERVKKRLLSIHELEIKRQHVLHGIESIHRDEEARLMKLKLLSFQDENARLEEAAGNKGTESQELANSLAALRQEFHEAHRAARGRESKFMKQSSEIAALKIELESLRGSVQDSGHILQEKFTLTRELDRLRPEIEHLRSQLSSHQSVIAEKHALQRQVDTLEVELDNQKRSKQKLQDKEQKQALDELRSQLADAERMIAAEKRESEKVAKAHEKTTAEVNSNMERLEERAVAMKDKIKTLQQDLKKVRGELDQERAAHEATRQAMQKLKKPAQQAVPAAKKRRVEEKSFADITIETPGNESQHERHGVKKRGIIHAPMGEKSHFSITPFLNRKKPIEEELELEHDDATASMAPGGLAADSEAEDMANNSAEERPAKTKPLKARGKARGKPLADNSRSRAETADIDTEPLATDDQEMAQPDPVPQVRPKAGQPARPKTKLVQADAPRLGQPTAKRAPPAEVDVKRRKRKLGGNSTLFDEEEGADEPPAPSLVKPNLAGKRKKTQLGGVANAFAGTTFSPLKRDRRGVGASFLA
ncbi:Rossmann-fold NAD(P)(+)-binding protein [Emericellopsis atlantica]|uniref:Rossmann-fold NAD(P)(+)-binding protein n=1 Tax=Emericellopsis atlantica TaxID=2614577 RepID=A0A9P8CLJ7_9HYPO|nr:Rossmann-fold NAD(P)(+)-binding protein [Emericellopsis atlantica]KAG9251714.1 Rossmann-fold NAD(P)(+)-binding protein [Emericellopsis atlantica]